MTRDHRRLAAIVSADVVGYSLLMGRDESATLAGLKAHRRELIDPKITEYGGRIVKTTGDGLLLEFPSVVDAVRCAVDVQRGMAERNVGVPPEQRIEFRIGINVGDIIIDGDDIFGDGVNVAARLQTLAEPGGICVSRVVRDQVLDKLSFTFDDLGSQQVKNIARPVEAYRVELGNAAHQTPSGSGGRWPLLTSAFGWRWFASTARHRLPLTNTAMVVAVGVIALVIAGSTFLWWNSRSNATPAPPAMSVGVMPLVASAGDAAMAQRAETLTRDLTSMLARTDPAIRAILAPARQTKAESGVGAAARTLDVRYLLEGEVRHREDATLINLRLMNGVTGEQVWNETVSLAESDATRDQMRALRAAVQHLRSSLNKVEIRRVIAQPLGDGSAMDYVLRARAVTTTEAGTLQKAREAHRLYEEALGRDPNLVTALLGLALALGAEIDNDAHIDRDRVVRRMDEVTSMAVNLNGAHPATWEARAWVLMYLGQWDASLEANAKATRLDPENSWLMSERAWLMSMSGRPAEALALIERAIALDPPGDFAEFRMACEAHLLLGQYEQAIAACEKAKGLSVEDWWVDLFLAAAYAHHGDTARAAASKAEVLRLVPGYTIARLKSNGYTVNPDYIRLAEEHFYSGLRKAGLPER